MPIQSFRVFESGESVGIELSYEPPRDNPSATVIVECFGSNALERHIEHRQERGLDTRREQRALEALREAEKDRKKSRAKRPSQRVRALRAS